MYMPSYVVSISLQGSDCSCQGALRTRALRDSGKASPMLRRRISSAPCKLCSHLVIRRLLWAFLRLQDLCPVSDFMRACEL